MPVVLRVLLGLAVMAVGFWMVWRTEAVFSWFGEVPWAERKMGAGSSRFFYKLLGILVAFIGIFIATNIISDILSGFAGIFIRG